MQPTLAESLPLIRPGAGSPAYAAGFTRAGTSVAVLDTGTDYTRAAFGSCTLPNTPTTTCRVMLAQDFAPPDNVPDDPTLHGTNVAGIILGVAPDTRILSLDVMNYDATTQLDHLDDVGASSALNWVVSNRAAYNIAAANMSFANPDHYTAQCTSSSYVTVFANLRAAGGAARRRGWERWNAEWRVPGWSGVAGLYARGGECGCRL
jgi:hypothetical protein